MNGSPLLLFWPGTILLPGVWVYTRGQSWTWKVPYTGQILPDGTYLFAMNVILNKYTEEVRRLTIDFSQFAEVLGGDTLASIQSVSATPSGLTLSGQAIVAKTVQVLVSAGTADTSYVLSAIVNTSTAARLEVRGIIYVEPDPD